MSLSLFGQDKAKSTNTKNRNQNPSKFNESVKYFGINVNFGTDNNNDFMCGFGLSYKYRYKYIGIGGDFDLYAFKGFWKKNDVIDAEIPHNDYYTIQNGNTIGGGINILLISGYKNLFINFGGTLTFLNVTTTNVSNVTGWKWKGNSDTKSYLGPAFQIQYYFLNNNRVCNLGLELKILNVKKEVNNVTVSNVNNNLDNWCSLINFKFGICL